MSVEDNRNSEEGKWRRNPDSSSSSTRNLPELKKRLLSRNRIYAFSYLLNPTSGNEPRTGEQKPGQASNSSISSNTTTSEQRAERKQGNLKERARKLIATEEPSSTSAHLDLWEASSLHTGTVKRRPGGLSATKTTAIALANASPSSLKFGHQPGGVTACRGGEGGEEGRSSSEQFHLVTTQSSPPVHIATRIMGNTLTRRQNKLGNSSNNKNGRNPSSLSHSKTSNFSRRIICGKRKSSSSSDQSSPESDNGIPVQHDISSENTNSNGISIPISYSQRSSPISFRNTPSPSLPPPPEILAERFVFQHQTRPSSSCQASEKTWEISHWQIGCDRDGKAGSSFGYQNDDKLTPGTSALEANLQDDNQFGITTPCWPNSQCYRGEEDVTLLIQSPQSDRSGLVNSCHSHTSCPPCSLPNEQLDVEQSDLLSAQQPEAHLAQDYGSNELVNAGTRCGKMETKFDKEKEGVSEKKLMTVSVSSTTRLPQQVSTLRLPLPCRRLGEQQKSKSDLSRSPSSTTSSPPPSQERRSSLVGMIPPQALVASLIDNNKLSQINYIKIYTDWANHYLDKARCKRHIQDLQVDVTDGVILADVVEAVTNQKVPDVVRKPKNSSQMLDNIQYCLVFLGGLGVNLEGITARDIRDGHLKAILSLFFQLSRYKQQQKQQDRDRHNLQKQSSDGIMMQPPQQTGIKSSGPNKHAESSKLPPFSKHGASTSIPTPGSVSSIPKKSGAEKGKGTLGIGSGPHGLSAGSVKPASGSSSRSTSPSAASAAPHSFIPTPRTSIPSAPSSARSSIHEKNISNIKSSSGAQSKSSVRLQNNNSVPGAGSNGTGKNNSSMLEKFKFFKDKDKGDKLKVSTGSKRTSSSSGFSSARSERSDSSISLNSETKAGAYEGSIQPPPTGKDLSKNSGPTSLPSNGAVGSSSSGAEQSQNLFGNSSNSTPRLAIKGFRQKIGKAISSKESKSTHSPKTSRKDQEAEGGASQTKSASVTRVQSKLDVNSGSGNSNVKELPTSYQSKVDSALSRKLEKDKVGGGKIESRIKSPRPPPTATDNNSANASDSPGVSSASNPPSFLRQPKPTSAAASRNSSHRYSGTGIPTRNSLIAPAVTNMLTNRNSHSRDELTQNNVHSDLVANANNINTSMSSINGLHNSSVGNGTGIPKPTAAVKGTTKMSVPREIVKEAHLVSTSAQNGNVVTKDCSNSTEKLVNGRESHKSSPPPASSTSSATNPTPPSTTNECTKPNSAHSNLNGSENGCGDPTKLDSSAVESPKKLNKNEISGNGVSVAMVSPMFSMCNLSSCSNNGINSMSSIDSSLSQSNSSEASVILMKGKLVNLDKRRGTSMNDHSSVVVNGNGLSVPSNQSNYTSEGDKSSANGSSSVSPMSKSDSPASPCEDALNLNSIKAGNDGEDEDELLVNVTPMEPILRNSPYGYIKGTAGPSPFLSPKSPNANQTQSSKIVQSNDGCNNKGRPMNSLANRQVYNPYCDPARLGIRKQTMISQKCTSSHYPASLGDYDYTEIDNLDTSAAGYLSDGDLLVCGNNGNRPSDGYLSESGASIYSRRIHQTGRSKEAPSSQGTNNKHALITEDRSYTLANGPDLLKVGGRVGRVFHGRFDDSSSLSSGISDLNEIPTDLTSSSVNSELSSPYASLQRTSSAASKKKQLVDPGSFIYRVVGSRSGSLGSNCKKQQQGSPNSSSLSSQPEIHSGSRSQVIKGFGDKKHQQQSGSINGIIENHYQEPHMRSEHGKIVTRDKHGNLTVSSQQHHYGSNGSSSNLFPSQSSLQQQHHSYSSAKRPDAKVMNNFDSKNKGVMGVKEEYYGNEMSDRLGREERDGRERHRNSPGHGPSSHNGHKGGSGSSGSSEGKRSSSSSLMKAAPVSFSYVRRSSHNGSGINGSSGSIAKYAMSPNSAKVSSGREKELLTAEEYKAAQVSLLSRLDSSGKGSEVMHPHSLIGPGGTPLSVTASPKTRTKVKISGGTQTTNDLHEMNRDRSHHHQTLTAQQQQQQQHHHHHHHHHHSFHHSSPHHQPSQPPPSSTPSSQPPQYPHSTPSENEYASSTCSRNSASFSTQSATPGFKSLSLTTPTATQLSQSLRERILGSQSLPKAASSSADYAAILAQIQQQQQQIYGTPNASKERMSRYAKIMMNDGSMSDTGGYSNYSEIQAFASVNSNTGSPYNWMRHSAGYASSITSAPNRLMGGGSVTEAESLESLSSNSSMAAQLRDARSNSLTQGRNASNHQNNDTSPSRSPRLNRSNSIRSTKSEKLYPSMMQRGAEEANPYYGSTLPVGVGTLPTSPLHGAANRLAAGGQGPYSSTPGSNHSVRLSMSPYSGFLTKMTTKEDEINGSSLSLVSTASSIYSSQEDRQAHEIRKLKRELVEAQEKVQTLTNQLSTNAHVVAAFEQSLSNMTHRLQSLSVSAEQKDSEVMELRRTIELLRKQSIEAGLTVASLTGGGGSRDGSPIGRQLSADSVSSINSISSACSGTSHSHTSGPSGQVLMTPLGTPTHHHHHHHHGATTSTTIPAPDSPSSKKKHTKGKGSWLRSSLKAFSRKSSKTKCISPTDQFGLEDALGKSSHLNGNCGDGNLHVNGNCHPHSLQHKMRHMDDSAPGSPILTSPHSLSSATHSNGGCSSSSGSHSPRSNGHVKGSGSSSGICEDFGEENASVDDLKKQLREKEMVLTDIRLEALTSAHQLESFKETVNKMRNEMLSLKQDNERLQRLVSSKSLNSSETSLQINPVESIDRRLSASEVPGPTSMDLLLADGCEKDGKRITVTAFLGCHGSFERYVNGADEFPAAECSIGNILVGSKANWEKLDASVRAAFKEYVTRLDPVTKLGLCADSVDCYNVGEVMRARDSPLPELLPCGYIVGDVNKIRICLRGAIHNGALDALAFETLIPKSVLQRYLTLLMDHGRMILCGPSGTGKSYLARKLGEFIVARSGKTPCAEAIATFSADHKNSKELRQYLTNLAEQCESGSADLPSVIILDNLHHVSSFGEVFNGFLHSKLSNSPIVIGTMSQSNSAAAKLQVHHNFRWILFGNHMDPVKGFLNRYLQRRLIDTEVQSGMRNLELARITEWIPKVWSHVNKFLEIHNSSDVTIGPRLFLSCPMDIANSQVWFTDLWHYSVVPYVVEAVKEGVQLYGKKAVWEDPTQFLRQTYPWTESHGLNAGKSALLSIRAEDVGYDKGVTVNGSKVVKQESKENDPLMNMLMRLQEAANYSGPQSNDSDTTSLDSHISLESTKDYTAPA